jgi:serine/threonine-protein kinase
MDGGNDTTGVLGSHDTAMAVATKAATGETAVDDKATPPASSHGGVTELIGSTLSGRYLVTRKVGQGGMGAVYEATHTLIGKKVAVKVLLEKYAKREAIVQRLEQEARLASSVGNEHIIDITDFGQTEDGRTFVVMEFLEGESLAECLSRETQLPEQRILRIISQAASALAAAHDKGIVHRDIKPENLFLLRRKEQDFVKVVDFGISKSLRVSAEEDQPRLTQTGMVLGTPLYMSPEQARGDDELDHRVDVYALGVIMYEAATGRVPFAGNNYLSVISQVLNEEPKPLREIRPELSEEFEAVVHKAMAKDRTDRYDSANEMLADVTALLDDPTRSTERAKITGPRKKSPARKAGSRVIVWVAGIAVVVAAVVVSVTQLVGSSTKAKAASGTGSAALVTPPAVIDAGAAASPADAAVVPDTEVIEVKVTSKPLGATFYLDGTKRGVTPTTIKVVKENKTIHGVAELGGYDDKEFSFNPVEQQDVEFKLDKPKAGKPVQHKPTLKTEDPQGSGAERPHDKTGGEMSGNPFAGSGTVPPKK